MENLGLTDLFGRAYRDKKVLVTGHTGFKGSWMTLWLCRMGAKVVGYAMAPATSPSHIKLLDVDCLSIIDDIRNTAKLNTIIQKEQPEIIFHLAAQALVRKSYQHPIETFDTNIMGLANLFETCRRSSKVKVVVIVTSDKCYENREWVCGYRENDALGGYDPYSASKACAEILTACYRHSFFPTDQFNYNHSILVASARAGNLIGGGDWSEDRLVPDIVKAANKGQQAIIRNPGSVRPWQHVLEALSGYLLLGQKLLEGKSEFAEAWNFGPDDTASLEVRTIASQLRENWNKIDFKFSESAPDFHEAGQLKLDSSKARLKLGWSPVWNIGQALQMTAKWYQHFYEHNQTISEQQLIEYIDFAKRANLNWTVS